MQNGWEQSAAAWIDEIGDDGDFGRVHVLDQPMLARVGRLGPGVALDLGCGEGRFVRLLRPLGHSIVGLDPTEALIAQAIKRDPSGDYLVGEAEHLPFKEGSFDLVVAYLSLIDIPDLHRALDEVVRVLAPGGAFLIANLTSFNTAALGLGWASEASGDEVFRMDHYLEQRSEWAEWRGMRVRNWHRPLSTYMRALLDRGLALSHFDEPAPSGGPADTVARYRRAPWFVIMEWTKPAA